jgi:CheY-like chemotaxis protein
MSTPSRHGACLQVRLVSSGIDGLLEIGREAPDLLITDLRMPGIDGFEMIRRLRADPQLQDLDIMVVSGLTDDDIATVVCRRTWFLYSSRFLSANSRLCAGQDHGPAAAWTRGLSSPTRSLIENDRPRQTSAAGADPFALPLSDLRPAGMRRVLLRVGVRWLQPRAGSRPVRRE